MTQLTHLIPLLLALAVLGLAMLRPAPAQAAYACGARTKHAAATCLVNRARQRHGVRRVSGSAALHNSARTEAERVHRCGFSHTPCGVSWTASIQHWAAYCDRWSAGEVLGRGYSSARGVVHAWLASPAHRAVLLGPGWEQVGVAHRLGVWVGHFGRCA